MLAAPKSFIRTAVVEAGQPAFRLAYRPALRDMPLWKIPLLALMRFLYFVTNISVEHNQGVCFSEEAARRLSNREGWFYSEGPIVLADADCLSEEEVKGLRHSFPASAAAPRYEQRTLRALMSERELCVEGQRVADRVQMKIHETPL